MKSIAAAAVATLAIACAGAGGPAGMSAEEADARLVERPFAAGGQIAMDLSAGHYTISGAADERVRVQWETPHAHDGRRVSVRIETGGGEGWISTDGPSDQFRVAIEVPRRSDVRVRLSAGDLTVRGIEGDKDISAWAGDLKIDVTPGEYRLVNASVTAGDVVAEAFDRSTGGLFRSLRHEDQAGRYTLRARLTAGKLVLLRAPAGG